MNFYSQILRKIILPISEFVFDIPITSEIKKIEKATELSAGELIEYQNKKLTKLLLHSVSKSEYYRNLKIEIDEKNILDNLKKFPILTKKLLKTNTDFILTQPKEKLIKNGSSGSTGEQTIVYWSKKEQTINRATQLLWWKWANYNIGNPLIQTGINPKRLGIKKYKDFFFCTKYIQAFSHNKNDIVIFLKKLHPKTEYTFAGYASSLFVISQIAIENNIKLNFKTAISWGDKLFDHYKISIYEAFNCKTFETYGSAEGFMVAGQKDLDYLYEMSTNVLVEILDDNGNEVADGSIGNVIITNLNGFAMPLIRYKIGDLAIKLPKEKYPIIRDLQLPIFQKIVGRDTDIVKTPSGNFMVVHSFTGIFEHIPSIKQFSIIQNNLTGIEILFIADDGFKKEILLVIKSKILAYLNEPFEINFKEVTEIKPTNSGKPQLIVSNL